MWIEVMGCCYIVTKGTRVKNNELKYAFIPYHKLLSRVNLFSLVHKKATDHIAICLCVRRVRGGFVLVWMCVCVCVLFRALASIL
jgi:hypothetical protein